MHPELTNLLPLERVQAMRREYFLRLATVFIFALAGVIIGSGALLVPSYLYLNHEIQVRQARSSEIDAILANSKGQEANDRLKNLTQDLAYLSRLQTTSSATSAIRAILAVPHAGVSLSGISFSPALHTTDGRMVLTGKATTRETLRAYDQALASLPFVANADLPISAYAKETDIPFSITLSGTLLP